jgi:hypothetical protein
VVPIFEPTFHFHSHVGRKREKSKSSSFTRLPRHGIIKYRGTATRQFSVVFVSRSRPGPPLSHPCVSGSCPPHVCAGGPDSIALRSQKTRAETRVEANRPPVAGGSISNHELGMGSPVPAHNVSFGGWLPSRWVLGLGAKGLSLLGFDFWAFLVWDVLLACLAANTVWKAVAG